MCVPPIHSLILNGAASNWSSYKFTDPAVDTMGLLLPPSKSKVDALPPSAAKVCPVPSHNPFKDKLDVYCTPVASPIALPAANIPKLVFPTAGNDILNP